MPVDRLLRQIKTGAPPPVVRTLANGANHNVGVSSQAIVQLGGPTGAFSTTGFAGGKNGQVLIVHNTTVQAWTIANANTGSVAANRITTFTGADVVLTGPSVASFYYDGAVSRWELLSARDSAGAH